MKKSKVVLLSVAASLFTLLATLVASSACVWGWYQPEEPKALRNK